MGLCPLFNGYHLVGADLDAEQIFAGADYAFNKQVKAYGYAGYLTLERGNAETKQPVAGTGLEFKF
jgi:predicted porin